MPNKDKESKKLDLKKDENVIDNSLELNSDTLNQNILDNPPASKGSSLLLKKDRWKNERFPMLEVVFDKLIQYLGLNLRSFLQTATDVKLIDLQSITFKEYIESHQSAAIFNIFKIKDWESTGVIMINNNMIYYLINILLGGKKYNRNSKDKNETRSFSKLEFSLVELFVNNILNELKNAFSFIYPLEFILERQESIPKLIRTIANNSPVIVCSIKLDMGGDVNGLMDLVIPHSSLDPIREDLSKKRFNDTFGQTNNWRNFLTQELLNTDLEISAVLLEEQTLLSNVLLWKKGTKLNIDFHKLDNIILRCDAIELMQGKLTQQNGKVAIQLDNILDVSNLQSAF